MRTSADTGLVVDLSDGLEPPLDDEALERLRWYLEDYLRAPYGVYEDRGRAVAEGLAGWGEALFDSAFVRDIGAPREIVIRSASPALLALPWELLRDPSRPLPLALDGVRLARAIPAPDRGGAVAAPGDTLRVLMVISRPGGARDVGYRMIARPVVELLAELPGIVELVVLRPPTLAALEEALARASAEGRPFQVVHFDGHGQLAEADAALIFERAGGGRDRVPAGRLAQVLNAAQVPLVVLNACQSGAIGSRLEAAAATRLLLEGTPSVVAMAYRVHPLAAAAFMAAFYERLFAGGGVAEAVGAGRRRLHERDLRPSARGPVALADWIVPVHYRRRDVVFPDLRARRAGERARRRPGGLEPVGAFVGRDDEFYALEVAARQANPIVLHGQSGIGKTELAKAFGRWWLDTGGVGRPDGVVVASAGGLDGVVAEIGLAVLGPDCARMEPAGRRAAVEQVVDRERLLLICDAPSQDLTAFAHRVASGPGTVIVTSRAAETAWGDVCRVEVGGLAPEDAIEYADRLLAPHPAAAARRTSRAFLELLEWLDGHPLCMRLTLPHLATTEPEALLADLRGTGGAALAEYVEYSFDRLPAGTRRLLPAVSLFEGVVDLRLFGFWESEQGWEQVLEDAAVVGLLSRLGGGAYQVHPALPALLAARWRREQPDAYEIQRSVATSLLLAAYARWLSADAQAALAVVAQERRTLCRLLGFALEHERWEEATVVAQHLLDHFAARGMDAEADAWIERALRAVGTGPALDGGAGALWLLVMRARAHQRVLARRLDAAAAAYLDTLHALEAAPPFAGRERELAETYAGLSRVAQLGGRLQEAREWAARSHLGAEEVGDARAIGRSHLGRGIAAQARGDLAEAEDGYRRALAVAQELDDPQAVASASHQLSILAWESGAFEDAHRWATRSLAVNARLGDRPALALSHHQLALVAQARGRLDEAEDWLRKSLAVRQELGDSGAIARCCHELGIVAQDRGRLDEAAAWLSRALAIREQLGDRQGLALTYGQLGRLAGARGDDRAALEWTVKCVSQFEEFPHPATKAGPDDLARLTAKLGLGALETCWQWVLREPLPDAVRAFVTGAARP